MTGAQAVADKQQYAMAQRMILSTEHGTALARGSLGIPTTQDNASASTDIRRPAITARRPALPVVE